MHAVCGCKRTSIHVGGQQNGASHKAYKQSHMGRVWWNGHAAVVLGHKFLVGIWMQFLLSPYLRGYISSDTLLVYTEKGWLCETKSQYILLEISSI